MCRRHANKKLPIVIDSISQSMQHMITMSSRNNIKKLFLFTLSYLGVLDNYIKTLSFRKDITHCRNTGSVYLSREWILPASLDHSGG